MEVMALIVTNTMKHFTEEHDDHDLKNNEKGYRECHIEPDWLLIYKLDKPNDTVTFDRTGSHSDLFK